MLESEPKMYEVEGKSGVHNIHKYFRAGYFQPKLYGLGIYLGPLVYIGYFRRPRNATRSGRSLASNPYLYEGIENFKLCKKREAEVILKML